MNNTKKIIFLLFVAMGFFVKLALATGPFPPGAGPWLDYWTFDDTKDWTTVRGYFPASATNVDTCELGQYYTAILDDTNGAWLRYNVTESDGTNHLTLDTGSLMFWFAPNWTGTNEGGTGPGEWSRFIEVGSQTTNASYGWWSLYTDPEGVNLYFSAQTNDGSGATYLSAPINWGITNRWHLLALTYSPTNSILYLDGDPVTNGLPVTYGPGPDVLTNGFFIGSDSNGTSQAHGMFDNLSTYNYQIDSNVVSRTFRSEGIWFYANPYNTANIGSAPSTPSTTPTLNAVTGAGNLITLSNAANCTNNIDIWLTNVVMTVAGNGTMNVQFDIAGGTNGALYDVFANSVLNFSAGTNAPWAWMGQGPHCSTYLLTNLPASACYLILGTPQDSDGDGLTDAYERLVSKTDLTKPDTDNDGISDSWEVLLGLNPLVNDNAQPGARSNYSYDSTDWLLGVTSARTGTVNLDSEGNILSVAQ
jgi:hypothetical protein